MIFIEHSHASLNGNNDHGLWLEQHTQKNWRNWNALLLTEQRLGNDYKTIWYLEFAFVIHYDLTGTLHNLMGIGHKDSFLKSVTIGPGIAPIKTLQTNTLGIAKRVWNLRSILETNIVFRLKEWEIHNRLRGEYQDYTSPHYKNYGNFRYQIILFSPPIFNFLKITPFIFNEFFFRNNTYHITSPTGLVGGLYENRFRVGISSNTWNEMLTGTIYWQWRPLKQTPETHPRWYNTYQFGLGLIFKF